jgi:hypothetical protein
VCRSASGRPTRLCAAAASREVWSSQRRGCDHPASLTDRLPRRSAIARRRPRARHEQNAPLNPPHRPRGRSSSVAKARAAVATVTQGHPRPPLWAPAPYWSPNCSRSAPAATLWAINRHDR